MPWTPTLYTDCVGYIYRDAQSGARDSGFLGLGLLVGIRSKIRRTEKDFYFVTNHHIWKGFQGRPLAVRINSFTGFHVFSIESQKFVAAQALDLAIAPLPLNTDNLTFSYVMDEQLVMQEDLQRLRIGLGSDVFMVCRTGQTGRGTRRNLCGLRFGNISLLPQDEEKFYLVEMRSVSGHSGSPVCVYDTPTVFGDQKDKQWQFAPLLIGLNRGHQTTYEKVRRITEGDFEQLRDLVAETNTAIASVVPAWHIRELLNCKKFVNQRFRRDAKRTPWDYFVRDVPKIPTGKKLMLRANGVAQLEDITLEDRKKAKALKKIARSGFKQSVPQKSPRRR